jgi:hypothetical protein
VEQVAHGVDEDHARPAPSERLPDPIGPEGQVEAAFKWMARHAAKALGETSSVAIVAPGRNFSAACDWIQVASVHSIALPSAMFSPCPLRRHSGYSLNEPYAKRHRSHLVLTLASGGLAG